MKQCSKCGAGLGRTGFSAKQWSRQSALRQCKACIAATYADPASSRVTAPTTAPATAPATQPTVRIFAKVASKQHQNLEVQFAPVLYQLVTPITRQTLVQAYNTIRQSLLDNESGQYTMLPGSHAWTGCSRTLCRTASPDEVTQQ